MEMAQPDIGSKTSSRTVIMHKDEGTTPTHPKLVKPPKSAPAHTPKPQMPPRHTPQSTSSISIATNKSTKAFCRRVPDSSRTGSELQRHGSKKSLVSNVGSASMNIHKLGAVPKYLQKIHAGGDLSNEASLAAQIAKKRGMLKQKKINYEREKNEVINVLKELNDLQKRMNKIKKLDEEHDCETFDVIDFTRGMKREVSSQSTTVKLREIFPVVDVSVKDFEQQIRQIYDSAYGRVEQCVGLYDNFAINSQSDEAGDFHFDQKQFQSAMGDFQDDVKREKLEQEKLIQSLLDNFNQIIAKEIDKHSAFMRTENESKTNNLQEKLDVLQIQMAESNKAFANFKASIANDEKQAARLEHDLDEMRKLLDGKEDEIENAKKTSKSHTINQRKLKDQNEKLVSELKVKEDSLIKIKNDLEAAEEKISQLTQQLKQLEVKTTKRERETKSTIDEIKAQLSSEISQKQEMEIKLLKLQENEFASDELIIKDKTILDLTKRHQIIKNEMDEIIRQKVELEESLKSSTNQSNEKSSTDRELIKTLNEDMKKIIKEKQLLQGQIEVLKHNLSQTESDLKCCEETLYTQHRLMKIRSELINSLKVSDDANKIKIKDLELRTNENEARNTKMNQILWARNEELKNLLSTLGSQQIEITRQSNMLRTLEESNRRKKITIVQQKQQLEEFNTQIRGLKNSQIFVKL